MKDFAFNPWDLLTFSESAPYFSLDNPQHELLENLNKLKEKYHFPAVNDDIGTFLSFLTSSLQAQYIFEMGSGYGHSAFWYLFSANKNIKKIFLTEKRDDLLVEFNNLNWPLDWKSKLDYYQGDAFTRFDELSFEFDFILIDGVKAQYLGFLEKCIKKLSSHGVVAIDNSYWRGSFLDKDLSQHKESAIKIKDLHCWIKDNKSLKSVFLPFRDGLTLISKK